VSTGFAFILLLLLRKMSDHFYYLGDSGLYVHESCCLGHPLTYVGWRRFWYGPLTIFGSWHFRGRFPDY
jgi:hypothetical protein